MSRNGIDAAVGIFSEALISANTANNSTDGVDHDVITAIRFSKWFVKTYAPVLAVAVIPLAIHHWLRNSSRKSDSGSRRRNEKPQALTITSSSSSSTLLGSESPPVKDVSRTEREPLLSPSDFGARSDHSFSRIRSYIRSILLYQPQPIPALTAPRNRLPPNTTTAAVTLLLALNLFYLFYRSVPSFNPILFADRAGFCFVANLPILYLLAAKCNGPVLWLTGWSYEGLNIFHRRLGEWMIFLAFIHFLGMLNAWYTLFLPRGLTLLAFLAHRLVYLGLGAFGAFLAIWITSTAYVRKWCYEVFLACHIVFQLVALGFLYFHHSNTRIYIAVTLAIWVVDRLIARSFLFTRSFVANLEVAADKTTTLLYIDIPIRGSRGGGICAGWQAGQHIFISVPALGQSHRYQLHPFTIASPAPPQSAKGSTWPLQLIIRSRDGFSKELLEYTEFHQHTRVLVDGPYGSTHALDAIRRADRTTLIAGGSGVSVTYPLSWSIHTDELNSRYVSTRTTYIGGAKHIPKITKVSPPFSSQRHQHLWVRQYANNQDWLTILPPTRASSESTISDLPRADHSSEQAVDLVDRAFNTRQNQAGRPDMATELTTWVETGAVAPDEKICVVVCGPDELARQVQNAVASLARRGWDINIIVDKFDW